MGRENANTMTSIGVQRVGHISLCALFGNASRSLNFISLYIILLGNVSKLHL